MSVGTALSPVPSAPILPAHAVEQSTAMVQQMAQAQIQSAYIWAAAPQNRRDWDVIEQQVLKECRRPAFCAIDPDPKKYGSSNAMYGVPRGGEYQNGRWVPNIVTGFTIRFAEMALPYLKSISVDLWPLGEDETQKIYRAVRTDYENNTHEAEVIVVPKTIERRKPRESDVVISTRTNSDGKPVYIVRATKEEMDTAKAALYSKAKRNLILSVLPGWLKKEAEEQIRTTQNDADAKDPDAAKKRIYDGFARLNIPIDELKQYIGHTGEPDKAELEELRLIYGAIAEGQTTWKAVLAAKEEAGDEDVDARIAEFFDKLQMTPAQQRPIKLKYVGQAVKLAEYLEGEVKKQANNGSAPTPAVTPQADTREREPNGLGGSQLKEPIQTNFPAPGTPTPEAVDAMKAAGYDKLPGEPAARPQGAKPKTNKSGW